MLRLEAGFHANMRMSWMRTGDNVDGVAQSQRPEGATKTSDLLRPRERPGRSFQRILCRCCCLWFGVVVFFADLATFAPVGKKQQAAESSSALSQKIGLDHRLWRTGSKLLGSESKL